MFTVDGRVRLYDGDPDTTEPIDVVTGRDELERTFAELIARYEATTYLNGQSLIDVEGDTATGETYCLAMHLLDEGAGR
ncbi:nuclear transport factor 2 family protein, partial [Streptomyces scabiei]